MLRIRFCVALLAIIVMAMPSMSVANDNDLQFEDQIVVKSKSKDVLELPTAPLPGGISRAKLYSNVEVCTVNPPSLNVGGLPPNPLSVRDWFITGGGEVTGFDLYAVNGSPTSSIATIAVSFFTGTDEANFGTPLLDDEGQAVAFQTISMPFLPNLTARFDQQGRPAIQRISVDYQAQTYTITDLSTGELVAEFENIDREGFTVPAGKLGVQVRLGGERSVCQEFGDKTIGVVMAGGGTGNVDGVHIFDIENNSACDAPDSGSDQFDRLCRIGWRPLDGDDNRIPCDGGNVCSLDRPYNGIALTLYVGPGEGGIGNNTIGFANTINFPPDTSNGAPDDDTCVGAPATVTGFLGDNPDVGSPLFDAQPDGEISLLDWGVLQDCFGAGGDTGCGVFDSDNDDDVTLADFSDFQTCQADNSNPICGSFATQFQDVDIYRVNAAAGEVVQVHVVAQSSPLLGPPSDPLLRILDQNGAELERSDDFARGTLDAYTTAVVPAGQSTLFLAVSSATNSIYDPTDFSTVMPIDLDDVGGYELTVRRTNPNCDSASNDTIECCNIFAQCTGPETEPNDTISDADAIGSVRSRFFTGTLGNGAFAENGQDFDLYKIVFGNVCDEGTPNAGQPCTPSTTPCGPGSVESDCDDVTAFEDFRQTMTVLIDSEVALGYETIYDTAIALYDSTGRLVAIGDQSARPQIDGNDQSRGQLAANIEGPDPKTGADGVYYLAVFGTDRGLYNDNCGFLTRPIPPTIFNPPHSNELAGTEEAELTPIVGGRVNLPTDRLLGCLTEEQVDDGEEAERYQCYQISISTSSGQLSQQAPSDPTETASPNGNDSISGTDPTPLSASDRLGTQVEPAQAVLGNGRFGAWQGDVDFYRIDGLVPGQLISANIGDRQIQPENHDVRSYLAFFDQNGFVFADQDYSLERSNGSGGIKDEISGTLVATIPNGITTAFLMVGIDAGRLDLQENTPFDARRAGTTQSRRFGTNVTLARRYNLSVTVMPQVQASAAGGNERMFATTRRGVDGNHTEVWVVNSTDERLTSHPPFLELNPTTGEVIRVLDLRPIVVPYRNPAVGDADFPTNLRRVLKVTSNPVIAYDGETLFIAPETCGGANGGNNCTNISRPLFMVDPDAAGSAAATPFGTIENLSSNARLSGMVELNGILYALDTANQEIRFWDKTFQATNFNGSRFDELGDGGGAFDTLFGDMTSDGTHIMMSCSLTAGNTTTAGICRFLPTIEANLADSTLQFVDMLADPVTNHQIEPGPRIGGIEYINGEIVASDLNGPLVTKWNVNADTVQGIELPREFFIERITARVPAP